MIKDYDNRKLTEDFITYEDMFIGSKVVSRTELVEKKGISVKKLIGIGGYKYFLDKYGLDIPSPYYYKNKEDLRKLTDYIYEFVELNGRVPLVEDFVNSTYVSKELFRALGVSYKEYLDMLELDWVRVQPQSKWFEVSNKDIIKLFTDIYKIPPTLNQLQSDYETGKIDIGFYSIKTRFGSYSEFLSLCGYKEFSGNKYSNQIIANDGHICDSYSEKVIDDFLSDNKISHKCHIRYKDMTGVKNRYITDFLLSDGVVVEYFGLYGIKTYNEKILKKLNILKEYGIKCIEIYPKDLKRLPEIFDKYIVQAQKEDKIWH